MISTAPYSSALRVLCAPSSARLEQITTGIGCWLMIFCRNVSPSMRGISISRVITSGTSSRMRSVATKGSAAVPITSISGSLERTSLRVCRTTAESSTIRTRILGVLISSILPRHQYACGPIIEPSLTHDFRNASKPTAEAGISLQTSSPRGWGKMWCSKPGKRAGENIPTPRKPFEWSLRRDAS